MANFVKFKVSGLNQELVDQHVIVVDDSIDNNILLNENSFNSDSEGNVEIDLTGVSSVGDIVRIWCNNFPSAQGNMKGLSYVGTVEGEASDSLTDIFTDMFTYMQADVSTGDTATSDGWVTQWGDLTGNGRHATQSDITKAFSTGAGVGGNNGFVVTTDGVMELSSDLNSLPSGDYSMFAIIGKYDVDVANTTGGRLFGGNISDGTKSGILINRGTTLGSEAVSNTSFTTNKQTDVFHGVGVIGLIRSGANLKIFINGNVIDLGSIAVDVTVDEFALNSTILSNSSPYGTMNTVYLGFGAFDRAITDTEAGTINDFVSSKYGAGISGVNVVWDGDSRTYGTGSESGISIPRKVSVLTAPTSTTYKNIAVGGQTTTAMVNRYASNAPNAWSDLHTKNLYVINGAGINDMTGDATSATIISNITSLCNSAIADGFETLVATVPPRNTSTEAQNTVRLEVNAWILSADSSIVNYTKDICADDRIGIWSDTYYVDVSHLNDAGQDIWAGLMVDAIESI